MTRDTIERWWRRAIVATLVSALAALLLMVVTGHEQGVHDSTVGFILFLVLLGGGELFALLSALYLLYALARLIMERLVLERDGLQPVQQIEQRRKGL